MVRALRIEYAGAMYHITSRGNKQESIFLTSEDRRLFIEFLGRVCIRCRWVCYAYCLMDNHYHLLIETPEGNLSKGMHLLNSIYTQKFNRLHGRVGHVFQGRFKGILVEKDAYLLELSRYIVLNPVRAKMVSYAGEWPWSSYNATLLKMVPPSWLAVDFILSLFGQNHLSATQGYKNFVSEGVGYSSPLEQVENQIYLGSPVFIQQMMDKIDRQLDFTYISKSHYTPKTKYCLKELQQQIPNRNKCIKTAYLSGQFTLKEIGTYFNLHYSQISRIIKKDEEG